MSRVADEKDARVLHLCSDFAKQHVYRELVAQLDALAIAQFIYVPVRSEAELGVNEDPGLRHARYRYSHVLRPWHRVLYRTKLRAVARDLVAHFDPAEKVDVVHAHFLFSDGGVALKLNERFGLPYVVSVRNTDVNVFMRLRPDLSKVCWRIVAKARNVVFIAPAYRDVMLSRAPLRVRDDLRCKALTVPNGVASFWIEHSPALESPREDGRVLKLLYVGDFSRNKNLVTTIRAAAELNRRRPTRLTLVGGGGDGEREVDALLATGDYPTVTRLPRVEDRNALAEIYRAHDLFVMPSFRETFGVVYIEALSQGLPIVHTRGQGIDGYFEPGTVAEPADANDVLSVVRAVLAIDARLATVRDRCVAAARAFAWPSIARVYADLYRDVAANRPRSGPDIAKNGMDLYRAGQ
jgi:glycosyltransferase involved in cell wall biosynthesis